MADQDFVMVMHSDAQSQMSQGELQKLFEWLAPTEYSAEGSEYQKHLQNHAPGTGSWIFETNQYKRWVQSEQVGTLWIKDAPGSGKSVVAANLIKTLSEEFEVPVLYFFIRNIISANSKPISIIRDLLAQLLPHSTQLATLLKRLMIKHPDTETIPAAELWELLTTSLSTVARTFIVVDALDEIEAGQEAFITDKFLLLGQLKPQSIKLLVTSRPLSLFEKPSENPHISILRLSGNNVDQDISTYISHRLDTQSQRELQPEEKLSIKSHFEDAKLHSLFLQARLMLDELLRGNEDVETLLTRLPTSMSEIYQGILYEYSIRAGISQEIQVQVLEWVTHASRPVRLLELAELLFSQSVFPNIHQAKDVLRVCCGPLLEVLDNETLSVIHHSFTEFLLDTSRVRTESANSFPVLSSITTHVKLVSASIDYILRAFTTYDPSAIIGSGEQEKKTHLLAFPFLQYSTLQWPYHFLKSMVVHRALLNDEIFHKLDILLESESTNLQAWLQFCADEPRKAMSSGEGIHIASYLGLTNYVQHLLQKGVDPNLKVLDGRTPIIFAASQGHAELVAVIASNGGDVGATDCLGLTGLAYAAMRNHGTVCSVLASCGAYLMAPKTNDEAGKMIAHNYYSPLPQRDLPRVTSLFRLNPKEVLLLGYTPIQFACEYGCPDSVESLMDRMTPDQRATVCLHWVAARGHSKVLLVLLRYPEITQKIDEVDENGNTPLILASRDINPNIVRILLQTGASVLPVPKDSEEQNSYVRLEGKRRKTQVSFGKTPLHAWAELTRNMTPRDENSLLDDMEKVVCMLVKAGCDVDVRSSEGFTPLFAWSEHFQSAAVTKKFVQILLDNGANPRATANCGSTPLHKMRGREEEHEAVLLLVKAGADIDAVRASDGKTPMLSAATASHDILSRKNFVKYGANMKMCDNDGNSILHYLIKKSSSKNSIEDWLDVCDVTVVNKLGETCLFPICHQWPGWGCEKILVPIIAHGANLEARNIFGRTALMEACCEGGNHLIRAFLQVGADAKLRDYYGKTCIQLILAAQPRNMSAQRNKADLESIIKDLIRVGADPKSVDYAGNGLLHSAASLETQQTWGPGPTALLKVAIKFGNPGEVPNYAGQTALHLVAKKRLDRNIKTQSLDIDRLDYLLSTGLLLTTRDRDGRVPVHLAAASSEAMLHRMISAGANIRTNDLRDRTPLHYAAVSLSNATGLLCDIYHKNNWSVDTRDLKFRTPLHDAASTGNFEAVKYLLYSGASARKIDAMSRTPLHAAATFRRSGSIARAEKEFYEKGREFSNVPPKFLQFGRHKRNRRVLGLWLEDELDQRNVLDIVVALLEAGADPSSTDYIGNTAYDLALLNGNVNIAHLLANKNPSATMVDATESVKSLDTLAQMWLLPSANIASEIVASLPLDNFKREQYLETAIYMGNISVLESLLASGFDPRVTEAEDAFTIVHTVVLSGQTSIMRTLAPYIGDINTFDLPLLHLALEREGSNLEMVKLLLEFGADPSATFPKPENLQKHKNNSYGMKFPVINECNTVLHKLSSGWCWWYTKAITVLVNKGIDLEATNSEGMTAVHLAIFRKDHGYWRDQCLDILLSSGAEINSVVKKTGLTALNMALEGGCGIKLVQKLLKSGADIGAGPNPPLISAIRGADLKGTKLLLDAGADPNAKYGIDNRLPLEIAADAWTENELRLDGLDNVISLLLESGADPFAEISSFELGDTKMFHYFCVKNAPIQPFLDIDIDIETRDQSSRTGLHAASSYYGYIDQGGMASWDAIELISAGADVDAVDECGNTPLNYSMQVDSDLTEIFEALISAGASVNIANNSDQTVLYHVLQHQEYDIDRKIYLIEDLIRKGVDPSIGYDDDGASNLHLLAELLARVVPNENDDIPGNFDNLEKFYDHFLALGCDAESLDNGGNTPAFFFARTCVVSDSYASKWSTLSTAHCRRFLGKCDVKKRNTDGDSLLHVIARRNEDVRRKEYKDDEILFGLLMEMGVDPKMENIAGVTPLDVAATCGKVGILEMFEREAL